MSDQQTIASLGLRVDSSQVVTATDNLDDFSASAERAEQATDDIAKASDSAADAISKSADSIGDASKEIQTAGGRINPAVQVFQRLGLSAGAVVGLTATAAAVIVLGKAYVEAARESEGLARGIALSGNAAGVTLSGLRAMVDELDGIEGTSHKAAEALSTFVATGKVGADNLVRFTAIAEGLERSIGVPVAETAKKFAALADEPSKAAAELQKSFNFLTPAIYDYIRAQEKAGDIVGAATTAQTAYAAALERQRAQFEQSAPLIIRAWRGIKDAAAEAWDAILGVGRENPLEKQIADLENARDRAIGRGFPTAGLEDQIEALRKLNAEQKEAARNDAARKALTDAYVESQREAEKAADDFAEAQKRINAAWAQFNVAEINRGLQGVLARYDAFSDELESQRSANLVADADYYRKRRDLIQKSADAEISALRKVNAELGKQDGMSSVERIQAQNKIAENEQRIAEIRIRTSSQLRIVDTAEQKELRETANAYADAQDAADKYVNTLIKRFRIESEGLGLGEKERQRLRDRADIESKFEDRRQELERDRRRGDITEEQFNRFLDIERRALEESLRAYDDYYADLEKKQASWLVGVKEGLNNFVDAAKNVSGQVADAIEGGMNRAVDAVVEFARTGKFSFDDLVKDILADLLRIELRVLASQALQAIFGQFMGAAGSTGSGSATQQILDARFGGGRNFGGMTGTPGTFGGSSSIMPGDQPDFSGGTTQMKQTPIAFYNTYNIGQGVSVAQVQAAVEQGNEQVTSQIYTNLANGRWPKAKR